MPLSPGQTTLATIRTAAQRRADMENSQFLTADEWDANINASYQELYDLLIQKYGDNYYVATPYTFTTDGAADQFPLPDDFYKLLGVDLVLGGPGQSITLRPFNFADRNRRNIPNVQSLLGVTNLQYRINGNALWLTPRAAAGQLIKLWYVPRLTPLANDADVVDGVSGWEEYVVVDAAIKAMQKEESDVSVLMAQKNALIKRIESAAENRDAGMPATVADTSGGCACGIPGCRGCGWGC